MEGLEEGCILLLLLLVVFLGLVRSADVLLAPLFIDLVSIFSISNLVGLVVLLYVCLVLAATMLYIGMLLGILST